MWKSPVVRSGSFAQGLIRTAPLGTQADGGPSERLYDHTKGMKVKEDATLATPSRSLHVAGETFPQEEARAMHAGFHRGQAQMQ